MDRQPNRRDFMKLSLVAGAPMALGASSGSFLEPMGALDQEALSFFETVRTRRSVRKFKPTPVPEGHIREILDAARLAPTSGNQQPWKFLVVQDPGSVEELTAAAVQARLESRRARGGDVSAETEDSIRTSLREGYLSAPAYIVVLTDGESRYPTYNHWDGPLAAGYLMLAARALGYGTVFITDAIPDAVTKEVFNIPDRYTRVCITPLGVPEAWPDSPEKEVLDDFIVHDRFPGG